MSNYKSIPTACSLAYDRFKNSSEEQRERLIFNSLYTMQFQIDSLEMKIDRLIEQLKAAK